VKRQQKAKEKQRASVGYMSLCVGNVQFLHGIEQSIAYMALKRQDTLRVYP